MNFRTIREAAEMLNISESRMRRAVNDGRVPSLKLGNRAVVDVDVAAGFFADDGGVSITEVSKATGLTVSAIRSGIEEGWIPCEKPGRAYVFQMDAVRAAIEARIREQMQRNKQ